MISVNEQKTFDELYIDFCEKYSLDVMLNPDEQLLELSLLDKTIPHRVLKKMITSNLCKIDQKTKPKATIIEKIKVFVDTNISHKIKNQLPCLSINLKTNKVEKTLKIKENLKEEQLSFSF